MSAAPTRKEHLLTPEKPYETEGFFTNIVFTNGIVQMDEDRLLIYYGACDCVVCLAECSVGEMLERL